ncbi:MAG TPA: hypothetical protein VGN72_22190 [Tepidisphaeraceae bacterium]|nr:hypothetical protein [Tepidisphaeraceae bacterium]
MKNRSLAATLVLTAALFAGCDDAPSTNSNTGTPLPSAGATEAAALPSNLRLTSAPAGATDITAAKASVKDGDRVVIRGVVAGRVDPIAENRAIVTLLDAGIATCDKNPSDGCRTPWDACCEPADVLSKNSVTVQVVDADGRPLKASLAAIDGVKPLAKLVVSGVADVSSDGVVLVNADGLFVE